METAAAALVAPPSPLLRAVILKSTSTGTWKTRSLALLHPHPANAAISRCASVLSLRPIAGDQHQTRRILSLPKTAPEPEPYSSSSQEEGPLPVSQQKLADEDATLPQPQMQATKETVRSTTEEEISDSSNCVRVKFMLSKVCSFGEQFLLVGDDSRLGQWDPSKAIPLEWSDGHIWTTELDLPVEKTFLFKFILRTSSGKIKWQPGPDRVVKTWETENAIIVSEDWENAEKLKIAEDQPVLSTEEVIHAGNITTEEEKGVTDENLLKVKDEERAAIISEEVESDESGEQVLVPGLATVSSQDVKEISFTSVRIMSSETETSLSSEEAEKNISEQHELKPSDETKCQDKILVAPEATLCDNESSIEDTNQHPGPVEKFDIHVTYGASQNENQWGLETFGKLLLALGFFLHEMP